ncbi:MAG: carboxymuconolactone decarboxylase family protein [Candidatus Freyarchaeota archaeon]|nr:carboxymuconolactone decarboxylase family protein [Candidatus Jordarchaeia archaeon]
MGEILSLKSLIEFLFKNLDVAVDDIFREMREEYGRVPFVAESTGRNRPELLVLDSLLSLFTLRKPKALSRKVAELVALSAATALGCDHCVDFHIEAALREGASVDEIFDVLMIVGLMAKNAKLAVGLRVLRVYSRVRRKGGEE